MMLVPIVEGHGDVEAVPVLLRRWIHAEGIVARVARPHRLPRGRFGQEAEVRRRMQLIAKETEPGDAVLALFDADQDCPAELGASVLSWMRSERPDRASGVVLAVTEFESWYVAAAASLVARGRLLLTTRPHPAPESIQDPKGWLSTAMGRRYSETLDQPRFAALFEFGEARACRSFVKFERELRRLLGPAQASG
jgi:hypothetical protein